jgi:hypothetical protein
MPLSGLDESNNLFETSRILLYCRGLWSYAVLMSRLRKPEFFQ